MASRFDNRRVFINRKPIYNDYLINRGTPGFVRQYTTARMPRISQGAYDNLLMTEEMWGLGDRLCKLAGKHYGDSTYWWVIAYFNNKPTDAHFNIGDIVYIPVSLSDALEIIGS